MTKILVAGIGNIFWGDDAFGVEVAQRMSRMKFPDEVHVVDYGIRGFDLAYALMDGGYDVAILVDAVPRNGEAGTLYTIEPDFNNSPELQVDAALDTHGMNPMRVFRLVEAMGGEFNRVLIVGCEPETLGPEDEGKMGLSEPVEAAVDQAIGLIQGLILQILTENNARIQ